MRRVVVTGLGMVTPLGCGVEPTWSRLLDGKSGGEPHRRFQGRRPRLPDRLPDSARRRLRRHLQPRSLDGAEGAAQGRRLHRLRDGGRRPRRSTMPAGIPTAYEEQIATGVLIGSGIGGLGGIYEASITLHEKGPRRISPFFIPGRLINLAGGQVSIDHGLKGPNHAVVTACSTGAHAIGDAARLIALGDADVMVAGGTESPVNRLSLAGFAACRALSTGFNDEPTARLPPLRPRPRRLRHGRRRRLRRARGIRARQSARRQDLCRGDRLRPVRRRLSHHRAVAEDGDGAFRCMSWRSSGPGFPPATSTTSTRTAPRPHGDEIELRRRRAPGRQRGRRRLPCPRPNRRSAISSARPARSRRSSRSWPFATRSSPPTLNLDNPVGRDADRPRAAQGAASATINAALSNSFGFGGTNASLVFRRVE